MLRSAALGLALLLGSAAVTAQVPRHFPSNALRGELSGVAPPDVLVDGKPARLAPGARVRNEENRFEVMSRLAGRTLLVHYTIGSGGLLQDIWILRPDEIARQPWPRTPEQAAEWRFDASAQSWSRP